MARRKLTQEELVQLGYVTPTATAPGSFSIQSVPDVWVNVPTPTIASPSPLMFNPTANSATPDLSFDPMLTPSSILSRTREAESLARSPLDSAVATMIAPQIGQLTESLQQQENVEKASAQSTFGARGLTGSSTELQTLTRDIPTQTQRSLAKGVVDLTAAALPIAQREREFASETALRGASLSTQLRSIMGDEQFKKLSLQQQKSLADQDAKLRVDLANLDVRFQTALAKAKMEFEAAENEADRAVAQQQMDILQQERRKARNASFFKSLTTLAGIGIGAFFGGPAGAAVGGAVGGTSGDMLGFMMP